MTARPLRLIVLCPHFAPDIAPTGVVMTRIVEELARRGHELHVVTALPWYRNHAIEPGWSGRLWRTERTAWGSVTRVHPFPGKSKRNLARRALGFALFSTLVGVRALTVDVRRRRIDGVLAMSPPLTLGLTGWLVRLCRGGKLVFNIQDVFPDAAVETGAITNRRIIAMAKRVERSSYHRSDAVVLLSEDLADNVRAKVASKHRHKICVVPNFVDVEAIQPGERRNAYRVELGIGDEPVVMYAGNVGFSQSLDLVLAAARHLPGVSFVINGEGSALDDLRSRAIGIDNVHFVGYQSIERLAEVLAAADVHVVPLRRGLARVSVPSKTYSILAAGRPMLAAIDPGTEVPRILADSGAGRSVEPDDERAFVEALTAMIADPEALRRMGSAGRDWVLRHVSPAAVAAGYESLFTADR
jgi:colanic acid biosynthesis glycosyl transferase WcaI